MEILGIFIMVSIVYSSLKGRSFGREVEFRGYGSIT